MRNEVIAISGASGFIGAALADHLQHKAFRVIELLRQVPSTTKEREARFFDLTLPPDPGLFTGVDILIHCALVDSGNYAEAARINFSGTSDLVSLARKSGVKKIIFFSSVSAHPHALSHYGQTKFRLEALFTRPGDSIIRCSLVIGDGGLFQQLTSFALRKKTIPLIGYGNQPMQVIALEDLLISVETMITHQLTGVFVLANLDKLTYRQFFQILADCRHIRVVFIPVSRSLLRSILYLADLFHLSLPVTRENVLGLESLRYVGPDESLQRLGLRPAGFEETIQRMTRSG